MGINTENDASNPIRQRHVAATLTEGAEQANVDNVQGLMDGLFAHKDEMAKRCESQLGDLFSSAKGSYGRARAVGMTAREASGMVNRVFKG